MKRLLLLALILFLISNYMFCQDNSAHHWYFGINAGVDFSTGVPTAVNDGLLSNDEGVATVDDSDGDLQFYTDGEYVYNANHLLMPNGTGLLGHNSATQSSIIIPYPGSDSLFYLFTVDAAENHLQNGLRYSLIDMSLDNGLGDIISSEKNILLHGPVTEKLTAVLHTNEDDVWLIAHKWNSNEFLVYPITNSGINLTPIITALGSVHQGGYSSGTWVNGWTNAAGYMKASMEGDRLALAIYRANIVEVFDFNKNTGVISNCMSSSNFPNVYGIEFSPNGSKLYLTQPDEDILKQISLYQPNPFTNAIIIANITQASAIQLAPNGKIYLSKKFSEYLGEIRDPDNYGISCNYIPESIYLNGKVCKRGLPGIFINERFQFFTGSNVEESICEGDSIHLENAYQTIYGIYLDTFLSYQFLDSFVYTTLSILPPPAMPLITEFSGTLWSTVGISYQWYINGNEIIGATGQFYIPGETGLFSVGIIGDNGCSNISDEYYLEYVSINEIFSDYRIFPNPNRSDFLIIEGAKGLEKVIIYNLYGGIIREYIKPENKVSIKDINSGVYIVEIYIGDKINPIVYKLIRMK